MDGGERPGAVGGGDVVQRLVPEFAPVAQRPLLLFGFVFFVDAGVAALAWVDGKTASAQPVFGLLAFALLGLWTALSLSQALLNAALVVFLGFAILHAVFPLVAQRLRQREGLAWGSHVFPMLALILALFRSSIWRRTRC